MQAVAILLVATTMGGDFPTTSNANTLRLPPPIVRPSQPRDLLAEAMRSADAASSAAAETARKGASRVQTAARKGVNFAANELRLDRPSSPTSRVVPAQYNQGGMPRRPVDGLMGPGSRAASSDPTAAYGGRMQAVPPRYGTAPATPAMTPSPTASNRGPATAEYRPASAGSYRPANAGTAGAGTASRDTNALLDLPPIGSMRPASPTTAAAPAVQPRSYRREPLAQNAPQITPQNNPLLDVPAFTPAASNPPLNTHTNSPNPNPGYPAPAGRVVAERANSAVIKPLVADRSPTSPVAGRSVAGYRPPTTNVTNNSSTPTNGTYADENIRYTGGSYFMTLLALFASVGLNLYLGWIAWDTYNRYQDLVADMRTTGSRRERRRERRRFVEPAASSAATY